MSDVAIVISPGDEMGVRRSVGASPGALMEFVLHLGGAAVRAYMPRAKAEELRDALTAALAEPEEARDGH